MSDPNWLITDIGAVLKPPLTGLVGHRSPEALDAILDQFEVATAARYIPRPFALHGKIETLCNIATSDATAALGCPVPHDIPALENPKAGTSRWQSANDNLRWLQAGTNGWKKVTGDGAQVRANLGFPTVVACDGAGHGHIAMLRPSKGRVGIWIWQAGARNYSMAPLVVGFGHFVAEAEFFTHL